MMTLIALSLTSYEPSGDVYLNVIIEFQYSRAFISYHTCHLLIVIYFSGIILIVKVI